MTAFKNANAVIRLNPQLSEVKQLGQIWLSDPNIISSHIGTYAPSRCARSGVMPGGRASLLSHDDA